jgi:chromosome segregation ATPase
MSILEDFSRQKLSQLGQRLNQVEQSLSDRLKANISADRKKHKQRLDYLSYKYNGLLNKYEHSLMANEDHYSHRMLLVQRISDLTKSEKTITIESNYLKENLSHLEEENADLLFQLNVVKHTLEGKEEEYGSQIRELTMTAQIYGKELQETREKLKEAHQLLVTKDHQLSSLTEEYHSERKRYEELEELLMQKNFTVDELSQTVTQQKEIITNNELKFEMKLIELVKEIDLFKEKNHQKKKMIYELQEKYQKAKAKISELKATSQVEDEKLFAHMNAFQSEIMALQNQISDINSVKGALPDLTDE